MNRSLAHYVDERQETVANYTQAQAAFPKIQADFNAAKQQWDKQVGDPHQLQMNELEQSRDGGSSQG